jgi:hypothetical protein
MSRQRIEDELAQLATLSRDDLAQRWKAAFGSAAPSGVRRELLLRGVAWDLQAKRLGGLSPVARRLLKAAKVEHSRRGASAPAQHEASVEAPAGERRVGGPSAADLLHPGSRLSRDWCGRPYVVDVIENGFVYDGKVYRSLSSIARLITGTNWSGPRFFGLVHRRAAS